MPQAIIQSDGLDGDVFPAGCWVLLSFAKDDVGFYERGKVPEALDVLCGARPGVPKRERHEVSTSVFNFRPKDMPPSIFDSLRALPCKLNDSVRKWDPRRLTLAVAIGELWHWCTSQRRCTRDWLLPTPFFDLAGFQAIPVRPVAGQVLLHFNNTIIMPQ